MKMDEIKLIRPFLDLCELQQMGWQLPMHGLGIEPQSPFPGGYQFRGAARIAAGKQRHIMAKIDERVAEKSNDPLGTPIELGGHRFMQRGHLRDLHG
jgi:hypothetical protein